MLWRVNVSRLFGSASSVNEQICVRIVSVAMAFVTVGCYSATGATHTIPLSCYGVDRSLYYRQAGPPLGGLNPYESDRTWLVLQAVWPQWDSVIEPDSVLVLHRRELVVRLWHEDTLSTASALAFIATEAGYPRIATSQQALMAGRFYRELYGGPAPILWILSKPFNDQTRAQGLGFIRRLESDRQRDLVLGMACDAGYLLLAWKAQDSAYARLVAGSSSPVVSAPNILVQAYRLLDSKRRSVVDSLALIIDQKDSDSHLYDLIRPQSRR